MIADGFCTKHKLDQLRIPGKFLEGVAELGAGFLLRNLGASVNAEPLGEKTRGPDWFADFGDVSIHVEVKCIGESDDFISDSASATYFFLEFGNALLATPCEVPMIAILSLSPTALRDPILDMRISDRGRLRTLALETAGRVQEDGALLPGATINLGRIGSLRTETTTGPNRIELREMTLQERSLESEAYRIAAKLEREGAVQLRATGRPGLLILDNAANKTIPMLAPQLEAALQASWAESIGAVLITSRAGADGIHGLQVDIARGPGFSEVEPILQAAGVGGARTLRLM